MTKTYIHPDDIHLFTEVSAAMRVVAKKYDLPVRIISLMQNPSYATSPLGNCDSTGRIRLTLRGKTNGVWDSVPRDRDAVYRTAAHELAHLRHMNHGLQFQEFEEELLQAITNAQENPTDKIINRIVKMQRQRDGEAAVGNSEAAENIAASINRMLIEYELNPSDLDYAAGQGRDPVIEMRCDLSKFGIEKSEKRVAWQESLARIIAQAHLCTFLIRPRSNDIYFVGTKAHATVAEYAYGTIVPAVALLSRKEYRKYRRECKKLGNKRLSNGYREAWIRGFVSRLGERFAEERRKIAEFDAIRRAETGEVVVGSENQALIRLGSALQRAQNYVDEKFHRKSRYARQIRMGGSYHAEGQAAGRRAADGMNLGRRALEGRAPALLGEG